MSVQLTGSMLKLLIPSCLGKVREESSWKWEVFRLGNVICRHPSLLNFGPRDIHKKLSA
jgi:hypothetical protein